MATEEAHVIVVGAGLSGLAAANRLREAFCGSHIKVIVLEGRDRVGGRAWTAHMGENGEHHVDIGGAWLQYPDENPLKTFIPGVKQHYTHSQAMYDETGKPIEDSDMKKMDECQASFIKSATAKEANSPANAKALDMLPMLEQAAIDSNSDRIERLAAIATRTTMENYLASSVEQITGFHLAGLFNVPHQEILKEGFEVATTNLAKACDIRLEHVVTKVEALGEDGVQVTTQDGKVFKAQKAVITVPLGVLKANKIEFVPPLPEQKQRAIRRIGFGVLDKVVMRFSKIFWPTDKDFFLITSPDRSLVSLFLNLACGLGEPILVGFHQGQYALENEKLTDDELAEKAMVNLRKMYGDDIPGPVEVVCTRWGTDPFALGSYTAPWVLDEDGPSMDDTLALAVPVGHLYFAGETASSQNGLLHGAYNSGIRAAEEIFRDGLQP